MDLIVIERLHIQDFVGKDRTLTNVNTLTYDLEADPEVVFDSFKSVLCPVTNDLYPRQIG